MTAVGVMLIGFGVLTAWSGWELVNVFDLLRSFIGAPAKVTSVQPSSAAQLASTSVNPAAPTTGRPPAGHGTIPLAPGGPSNPVVSA